MDWSRSASVCLESMGGHESSEPGTESPVISPQNPMEFQSQWERHVGKIEATARFFCVGMTAEQVTEALGVEPTDAQTTHEPANFGAWGLAGGQECTLWTYDASSRVSSSDINTAR